MEATLQQIKYQNLEYGEYDRLKKRFLANDFDPDREEKLDLSHHNATRLPSVRCLELLKNLRILVLSDNRITRFSARDITKHCRQIEWLDLSNNLIDVPDDLIDLGTLEKCQALDVSGNPLCGYMRWINILRNLLYPEKYSTYNPVRILTADYHAVPKQVYDEKMLAQQKKDREIVQKHPDELEAHEWYVKVSKYNHKKTLAKFSVQPCPIPRKSRFKNLTYLNDIQISLFDVMRASGTRELKEIVEDHAQQLLLAEKQTRKQKRQQMPESSEKTNFGQSSDGKKRSRKMHEYYLKKYKQKITRELAEASAHVRAPPKEENEDELEYLMKIDLLDMKRVKAAIDPRHYAADIWEQPLDIKYRDAEYNVSIREHKQMLKEYREEKRRKKEQLDAHKAERKQKNKALVNKRLQQQGFGKPEDFPSNDDIKDSMNDDNDDDDDMKETFSRRKKTLKPKLNLERQEYHEASSQSSLSEEGRVKLRNSLSLDEEYGEEAYNSQNFQAELDELEREEESSYKNNIQESPILSKNASFIGRQTSLDENAVATSTFLRSGNGKKKMLTSAGLQSDEVIKREAPIFETMRKAEEQRQMEQQREKERLLALERQIARKQNQQSSSAQQSRKQTKNDVLQSAQEPSKNIQPPAAKDVANSQQAPSQEEGNKFNKQANSSLDANATARITKPNNQSEEKILATATTQDDVARVLSTEPHLTTGVFETDTAENVSRYELMHTGASNSEQHALYPSSQRKKYLQDTVLRDSDEDIVEHDEDFASAMQMQRPQSVSQPQFDKVPLQTAQFEFWYNKKRPITQKMALATQQQDRSTFRVKNKIFYAHQNQKKVNQDEKDKHQMDLIKKTKSDILRKLDLQEKRQEKEFEEGHTNSQIAANRKSQQNFHSYQKTLENAYRPQTVQDKPKVIVHGDLKQEDFLKSDIPMEDLIPNEEQGLDRQFKNIFLYDPRNKMHQQIKYYKRTLDEARNLRKSAMELNRKIEITSAKKQPIQQVRDAVPYERVIEYLKTDPAIHIQGTFHAAEKAEYELTRKRPYPHDEKEISTWELRDIINKANNYENRPDAKITEKEITEALQRSDLPFEQKKNFYDWQEILEEIKLRKNKNNEVLLSRLEKKEVERAESNAHLAYHYSKMKKYLPPEYIENQMKKLGMYQEDPGRLKLRQETEQEQQTTAENAHEGGEKRSKTQKTKQVSNNNNNLQYEYQEMRHRLTGPTDRRLEISHNPNYAREKEARMEQARKILDQNENFSVVKQKQKKAGFFKQLEELQNFKLKPRSQVQPKPLTLVGPMVELIPNINDQINQRKPLPPAQIPFEEMVQQNLRKMQDNYTKQENLQLTMEEQMMKYAKEFEQRVKQTERLKKNIESYIGENQNKLAEFREWNVAEELKRHDKDYCFKSYVKMVRDGKIPGHH